MFIAIAVSVGLSLLSAGLTYLMSDPDREPFKGPWSGDPNRYRPVDGDHIPVIFGTVDIAPAVVWSSEVYDVPGDATEGPPGYVGNVGRLNAIDCHWVLASGPVDSIREVHIRLENEHPLTILGESGPGVALDLTAPGVQEGVGVKWVPGWYVGDASTDNVINSLDVTVLPGLQNSATTGFSDPTSWGGVGFRHVTSMAGKVIGGSSYYFDQEGAYTKTNSTPGSVRMRVTRIFSCSFGDPQWYPEKAAAPNGLDMNPIHAIREALTDSLWGSARVDPADIDDTSFREAADLMHSEGVFMSARLTSAEELGPFLAQMFSLCNAVPYEEPTTGKYKIAVATGDYDAGTIPVFGDHNATGSMTRQHGRDQTTRMTVKYTKRYERESGDKAQPLAPDFERVFSQTDPAGYDRYGEVELVRDYTEVHDADLASKLATRDLLQSSRPLASLELSTTWGVSAARDLRPGAPFIWGSDIAGIPQAVYRVTSINFGSGASTEITVEAVEDAFAFNAPIEPNVPETEWEDPTEAPYNASPRKAFQLPLWLWYQLDLETNPSASISDHLTAGARPYGYAAGRPNADSRDFGLWVDGYTRLERARFSQFFTLKTAISRTDTTIEFDGDIDLDLGSGVVPILYVGDELIAVTAWDAGTKTATVCRGWLDTVPTFLDIPKTTPVALIGALYDDGQRFGRLYETDGRLVSSETVDIKALTRTSAGQLSAADALTDTLGMGGAGVGLRSLLQLAPTYVRAEDQPSGDTLVSWVVRERTGDPTCDKPGTSKPPTGFTYTMKIFKASGGGAVRTVTGISGDQWTYTGAMQAADGSTSDDLVFQIWAVDGSGRESWQKYARFFTR